MMTSGEGGAGTRPAPADAAIRIAGTAAVLVVAGIAAYISYRHAYELAVTHGEAESTARLWPLTVDGTIAAASLVILQSARRGIRGWRALWLAYSMLGAGIAATIAANVAHGVSHGPTGAAVAALPALALVGSYELLMWLVRAGSGEAARPAGVAAVCQCEQGGAEVAPVALSLPEAVAQCVELAGSQRQFAEVLGVNRKKLGAMLSQPAPLGDEVAQINGVEILEPAR